MRNGIVDVLYKGIENADLETNIKLYEIYGDNSSKVFEDMFKSKYVLNDYSTNSGLLQNLVSFFRVASEDFEKKFYTEWTKGVISDASLDWDDPDVFSKLKNEAGNDDSFWKIIYSSKINTAKNTNCMNTTDCCYHYAFDNQYMVDSYIEAYMLHEFMLFKPPEEESRWVIISKNANSILKRYVWAVTFLNSWENFNKDTEQLKRIDEVLKSLQQDLFKQYKSTIYCTIFRELSDSTKDIILGYLQEQKLFVKAKDGPSDWFKKNSDNLRECIVLEQSNLVDKLKKDVEEIFKEYNEKETELYKQNIVLKGLENYTVDYSKNPNKLVLDELEKLCKVEYVTLKTDNNLYIKATVPFSNCNAIQAKKFIKEKNGYYDNLRVNCSYSSHLDDKDFDRLMEDILVNFKIRFDISGYFSIKHDRPTEFFGTIGHDKAVELFPEKNSIWNRHLELNCWDSAKGESINQRNLGNYAESADYIASAIGQITINDVAGRHIIRYFNDTRSSKMFWKADNKDKLYTIIELYEEYKNDQKET